MKRYIIALAVVAALHGPQPVVAQVSAKPLSLAESIALALEKNAAVQAAEHEVRGADYERKAARSDFLPKVTTGHSYTRYDETPYAKSPAGEFGPEPMKYKTGTQSHYQWNTSVTQPVFTGGALASSYAMARLGRDMAQQSSARTKQDIILEVKQAYFTILKADKIKQVAARAVEQVASHAEVAKAFYEEQMVAQNDYLQAQVRLAQARQNLIRADNGAQVSRAWFNTVLSRGVSEPVALEDVLICTPRAFSLDNATSDALALRPEIKEASLGVEKAQKGIRLAQSSYYPSLSLVADYRKMGEKARMNGSHYEDGEVFTAGTVLRWDIWEWGRNHYKVGSSKAQAAKAAEQKRQVADAVSLEVKQAWLDTVEAEKNIGVTQTAIVQAEENFRLYREQYAEQMATSTDVLDAQTLLTEAKSNYYNALSDYHIAAARLERAAGWDVRR
ncbi:MAG: TolC family protein [Deltaproteobacteria bacterium]|nr:TolC family protein [Deltaproteobacteria bacterium]